VRKLLKVVNDLQTAYPKKPFTLDGRLVGDIGEALAEHLYQLEVFDRLEKHHDARTPDGRLVQIKATIKPSLTFPAGHVPDLLTHDRPWSRLPQAASRKPQAASRKPLAATRNPQPARTDRVGGSWAYHY
jgi:hypothetical protein